MKNSIKTMFMLLAIVMSIVAAQSVCAETGTVTGVIESISVRPNKIVVNDIEISGIKFNYLCRQYSICLDEGDSVSVDWYTYLCSDGSIKYKAYKITVEMPSGDVTVELRKVIGT